MTQTDALLLSVALEAVAAAALLASLRWGSGLRGIAAAALGTLVTHGAAWWSCQELMQEIGYGPALIVVEAGVVGVESIAYRLIVPLSWARAATASAIVNLASTLAGLALYALDLA